MLIAGARPETEGFFADFAAEINPELAAQLGLEISRQAGIRPLPIGRMRRQAGRRRNEGARKSADKIEQTIRNADPQEAEWRQRENNWRDNPRSRRVDRGNTQQFDGPYKSLIEQGISERAEAFARTRDRSLDNRGGADLNRFRGEQQEQRDLQGMRMSTFLKQTNPRYEKLREGLFGTLDERLRLNRRFDPEAGVESIEMQNMPSSLLSTSEGREVANDLLYEWRSSRSLPGPGAAFELIHTIDTPGNPGQSLGEIMFPGV